MNTSRWDSLEAETSSRDHAIREFWIEYRVAAQFSSRWDSLADEISMARERRGVRRPPDQSDARISRRGDVWRQPEICRSGAAHYWMQQVDIPPWFKRDELGIGSGTSIFLTLKNLVTENRRRRNQYSRMVRQLDKARKGKVLRRVVRG